MSVCGAGPPASGWTQPIWGGGPRARRPGNIYKIQMEEAQGTCKLAALSGHGSCSVDVILGAYLIDLVCMYIMYIILKGFQVLTRDG